MTAALTSAIALALAELDRRRDDAAVDPEAMHAALLELHRCLVAWAAYGHRTNAVAGALAELKREAESERDDEWVMFDWTPRDLQVFGGRNGWWGGVSTEQLDVSVGRWLRPTRLLDVLSVYEPSLADLRSQMEERMRCVARITRDPDQWLRDRGAAGLADDEVELEKTRTALAQAAARLAAFIADRFPLAPQ